MAGPSIRGHQARFVMYENGTRIGTQTANRVSVNQDSNFIRSKFIGNPIPEGDQSQEGWSGTVEFEVKDDELETFIDALITFVNSICDPSHPLKHFWISFFRICCGVNGISSSSSPQPIHDLNKKNSAIQATIKKEQPFIVSSWVNLVFDSFIIIGTYYQFQLGR